MADKTISAQADKTVVRPPSNDSAGTSINAPEVSREDLKGKIRAVTSIDQIIRICEAMFNPGSERNRINGIIAEKYNDGTPFDQREMKLTGEDWRHNFPTGFMSGIINQVVTAPVDIIDAAESLTNATLEPEDDPDGAISKAFQKGLTKLVRSWPGWRTHIYSISQEDTTFGYGAATCLDTDNDDWRPREFRQDEFGVPDGNGQHSTETQYFAIKHNFMIDEIMKKINPLGDGSEESLDAADIAGWNIDEAIDEVNKAMPQDRASDAQKGATPRAYSDLVREGNVAASNDPRSRTIDCYGFAAREADGKVSHYIVTRSGTSGKDNTGTGHRMLFECEDQYEKMEEVLTLYSLEPGNTKLYGSKGLGRKLINLHLAAERARNRACDQMYLSSMIWLKSEKGLPTVQFKVRHPFGIVGSEAEIESQALPENIEPFLKLDERLTAFAEAAAGSYIPNKLGEEGPRRTAHEVVIEDTRESQQRQAYLKRFFGQFADEIMMITKIACKKDTRDPEAKLFQEEFFKAVGDPKRGRDLLDKLMALPAVEVVQDLSASEDQRAIAACQVMAGNPFADQLKLARRLAIAAGGVKFANDVIHPNGIDPTREAEQYRQQTLETSAIRSGESMNVTDSDAHKVHLDNIVSDFKQAQPKIEAQVQDGSLPPAVLDNVNAETIHANAHIDKWENQARATKSNDQLQQIETYRNFFKDAEDNLVRAAETLKETAAQRASQPAAGPSPGTPMPPPGSAEHLVKLTETIPYDKAPPQIQRQLESMFGLVPAYGASQANNWGGPTGGAPAGTAPSQETGLTPVAAPATEQAQPEAPQAPK